MTIYWFMLIWVICFGTMSYITSRDVCIGPNINESRANILMAVLTFSVIIFFAACRTSVADTSVYIDGFNKYPLLQDAKDIIMNPKSRAPGFEFFTIFIKTYISDNPTTWLTIIEVIIGICIMYTLYKYSCNYGMSMFLFMASCQFTWMFNGMRQFLAAAIIFGATNLILKNRFLPYMLIIFLMFTIHQSAIILIPMYFVAKGEPWKKETILFIGIIIFIAIFADQFTELLYDSVEGTSYESSMNEFREGDDGASVIRIAVESIPVIIAFIYREKIKDKLTPIIKLSINMSLIASGFYVISKVARSGIMLGRIPIYFSMYNLILLPWLIKNVFTDKKENRLINYTMIICYLIYFYYQMVITWKGFGYGSSVLNIWY